MTFWRRHDVDYAASTYDPTQWNNEGGQKKKKKKKKRREEPDQDGFGILDAVGLGGDDSSADRKYKRATLKVTEDIGPLGLDLGGVWPPDPIYIVVIEPFGF